MSIIEKARRLRNVIESLAESMNDEEALESKDLFPLWRENVDYEDGTRVRYEGTLYKCLQPHTSQPLWSPNNATSLFAEVLAGQEGTEIDEWKQPDSTNPYMLGDKVYHVGKLWESIIDFNVWEPGVYGWEEVIE